MTESDVKTVTGRILEVDTVKETKKEGKYMLSFKTNVGYVKAFGTEVELQADLKAFREYLDGGVDVAVQYTESENPNNPKYPYKKLRDYKVVERGAHDGDKPRENYGADASEDVSGKDSFEIALEWAIKRRLRVVTALNNANILYKDEAAQNAEIVSTIMDMKGHR